MQHPPELQLTCRHKALSVWIPAACLAQRHIWVWAKPDQLVRPGPWPVCHPVYFLDLDAHHDNIDVIHCDVTTLHGFGSVFQVAGGTLNAVCHVR